jgi:archaemetzincin
MRARRLVTLGLVIANLVLLGFALAPAAQGRVPPERVVAIVPLGPVRQAFLERVTQEIQGRMNVRIRVEPARELPKDAWYAPRRRWRAEKLLDWLDENPPPGAWKVVAVTEAEISTTKGDIFDWGIAGLGNLGGQSCVVSAYIYKKHSKTEEALLRRLGDLAVHEFGHTLGFPHCEEKGCVMSDAKGKAISSADASSGHYCAKCLGLLSPEDRALMK